MMLFNALQLTIADHTTVSQIYWTFRYSLQCLRTGCKSGNKIGHIIVDALKLRFFPDTVTNDNMVLPASMGRKVILQLSLLLSPCLHLINFKSMLFSTVAHCSSVVSVFYSRIACIKTGGKWSVRRLSVSVCLENQNFEDQELDLSSSRLGFVKLLMWLGVNYLDWFSSLDGTMWAVLPPCSMGRLMDSS